MKVVWKPEPLLGSTMEIFARPHATLILRVGLSCVETREAASEERRRAELATTRTLEQSKAREARSSGEEDV